MNKSAEGCGAVDPRIRAEARNAASRRWPGQRDPLLHLGTAPGLEVIINEVATEWGPEGRKAFTVDAGTTGQLGGWTAGVGAPVLVLHGAQGSRSATSRG